MIRTHDAGALTLPAHVGQTVTLAGWVARRRDHGGVAFLDLRERSGVVQVVVRDEAVAHGLRAEYVLPPGRYTPVETPLPAGTAVAAEEGVTLTLPPLGALLVIREA